MVKRHRVPTLKPKPVLLLDPFVKQLALHLELGSVCAVPSFERVSQEIIQLIDIGFDCVGNRKVLVAHLAQGSGSAIHGPKVGQLESGPGNQAQGDDKGHLKKRKPLVSCAHTGRTWRYRAAHSSYCSRKLSQSWVNN